jgi:microcystin-dependent protein
MSTPFLCEIKIVAFNYAPKGWAMCNGQLLPINQNAALFALIGTFYGGNGVSTFALPNLQGRVPLHFGNGFTQGQNGGEDSHTLTINEMPAHTHVPNANGNAGATFQASPTGGVWGNAGESNYAAPASGTNTAMATNAIANNGGSQPHENRGPFLTLNYVIALQGIFPSRN